MSKEKKERRPIRLLWVMLIACCSAGISYGICTGYAPVEGRACRATAVAFTDLIRNSCREISTTTGEKIEEMNSLSRILCKEVDGRRLESSWDEPLRPGRWRNMLQTETQVGIDAGDAEVRKGFENEELSKLHESWQLFGKHTGEICKGHEDDPSKCSCLRSELHAVTTM